MRYIYDNLLHESFKNNIYLPNNYLIFNMINYEHYKYCTNNDNDRFPCNND